MQALTHKMYCSNRRIASSNLPKIFSMFRYEFVVCGKMWDLIKLSPAILIHTSDNWFETGFKLLRIFVGPNLIIVEVYFEPPQQKMWKLYAIFHYMYNIRIIRVMKSKENNEPLLTYVSLNLFQLQRKSFYLAKCPSIYRPGCHKISIISPDSDIP